MSPFYTAGQYDHKWTYDEYLEELKKPIEYPDPQDHNDPLYSKKYAHTIAPPESYLFIPDRKDGVITSQKTTKQRKIYFGWNNMTEFEKQGVADLKRYLYAKGVRQMPHMFAERDWLKWIAAEDWKVKDAGDKLIEHMNWLRDIPPEPRLNQRSLHLLQSGCFYLHGRDKWYRPCYVMDGARMAAMAKREPDVITAEAFDEMFKFIFAYYRNVMFVPGQAENWVTICDLNNMSVVALPRKQIIAFGNICQGNLMFYLFKSIYTSVGWG